MVLGHIETVDYVGGGDIQVISDLMDGVQDALLDYQVSASKQFKFLCLLRWPM